VALTCQLNNNGYLEHERAYFADEIKQVEDSNKNDGHPTAEPTADDL